MPWEIVRRLRHAMPREIVGCGANREANRPDLPRDQAGVAQPADAHANIELSLEHRGQPLETKHLLRLDRWFVFRRRLQRQVVWFFAVGNATAVDCCALRRRPAVDHHSP